jgi:predicted ATPase/DNA-binding winged helix-turn-helix (wHTH) protein
LIYGSGEWEVDLARRELRVRTMPVPLGGRAFEIFEVLVQSVGELVTKDDLIGRVWRGAIVEEHTLQVHISAIRKALGVDRRMLKTASGRGYRLLGSWTVRQDASVEPVDFESERMLAKPSLANFPMATSDLIGRATAVQQLRDLLSAYRMVTLTGPGGIGKTALALEVARRLFPTFDGDGWLVDLVSLLDPGLVPSAVADVLSLKLGGGEISAESIARAIGGKTLLLVLDNCEHVVDAVARLAETLVRLCPRTTVLATSREILRIEGEYVYRVPPLDLPTLDQEELGHVLEYGAVQLFITRIRALASDFSTLGANPSAIAAICRRLDGIPLAIELAAARSATLGLPLVASRFDDRFRLLTRGRRTALPRHRTLRETLDWSYELLPEEERRVLRRLAIFVARFTVEAATAVMSDTEDAASAVVEGIANLVEKSLVTFDGSTPGGRWRLLETIRAYALEKLAESGEAQQVKNLHAEYYRDLFGQAGTEWEARPEAEGFVTLGDHLGDVRAALEWSFSSEGNLAVGTALAAASARVFLEKSLLTECYHWTNRAITALDDAAIGTRREMELQTALGVSLMFTQGNTGAVRTAFVRGLELAEIIDDPDCQRRLLSGYFLYLTRTGDFHGALSVSQQVKAVAVEAGEHDSVVMADWMMGVAYHNIGDQAAARTCCESAITEPPVSRWQNIIRFGGHDYRISALIVAARALWLVGNPDKAVTVAMYSTNEAELLEHPLLLCTAQVYAAHIFLWVADWPRAVKMIERALVLAVKNSLVPFHAHALLLKGALSIKRGEPEVGISIIRGSLETLSGSRYNVMHTVFLSALAEGLTMIGQFDEALATIDRAIAQVGGAQESFDMPEILRIKGEILWNLARPDPSNARKCLLQSLECARKQSALGWELRTAMSLARLWSKENRAGDALALLAPLYARYTEGFESGDLKGARNLLNTLGHSVNP